VGEEYFCNCCSLGGVSRERKGNKSRKARSSQGNNQDYDFLMFRKADTILGMKQRRYMGRKQGTDNKIQIEFSIIQI
jgi:hypothetical protein